MSTSSLHPNTSAMLQAWTRITKSPDDVDGGPSAEDFPELLGRLFIIESSHSGFMSFRIAGDQLSSVLGRNLIGTNFLSLWIGPDRELASALLQCIISENRPGLLRGYGETSHNRRVEIEIAIAPLGRQRSGRDKFLCLYQTLGGEAMLNNKSVWSHRIRSLHPPEPERRPANLRLVQNNTG